VEITAAVLRAGDQPYSIETVELAEPRADEVLVRIVGVGMCHTDVLPRAEATISPPPIICGHEGAGVVEAVGSDVEGVAVGDHVVLSFESCGACEACRAARPYACEQFWLRNLLGRRADFSTGVTDASGAEIPSRWFGQSSFATHAVATARNVVVVDPSLPLEQLGPLGCGIQTGAGTTMSADALDVQPGTSVVIFGVGAVGLAALMGAVVKGATTIIAVDLHQSRLDLAVELGATHTIPGDDPNVAGRVAELTGGAGAHYAVDTTGVPAVSKTAMTCVRLGGRGALVGAATSDMTFDVLSVVGKTAIWVLEGNADPKTFIPELLELWQAGRFPFDRLIEEFPLTEIDAAEEASLSGRVVKPVLRP
jgi:aryl-alcohol dehydrogenase